MRSLKSFLLLFLAVASGMNAQNLIEGYNRIFYADDLQEGKTYFIISDRTKYAGNSTGKPKGMSYKLDSYTISWDVPSNGIYFVYWGDFNEDEEGFQWIAEKVGDDQWAFKNKVWGEYLGVKNSYDDDVLFSATPVGYTLSDLEEGAGRFFMTSSENTHSPHVQGYLRSDRPNNSLAKQYVGDDDYKDDVAQNGYPGRWQIYEVESSTGNPWITDVSEIVEGEQYYIVSDRTKFNGNNSGLPKAMSTLQSNYSINWGDQYVYWGDLDKESDGYIWTAQKVGEEGQWAFLNKENNKYLGNMNTNPVEADVVFSDTPIGYTLTDLSDGAGRFFMTNDESEHSPHVQGYLRSDRPNNSLAKQGVGDDDYPGDGATAGYPGRWKLLKVNPSPEDPSVFFNVANGYYNILYANSSEKMCWTDLKNDTQAYELGASLILNTMHSGDPRSIYRIEAVDRENGLYNIRNYVTGKYVGSTMKQNLVCMTEEAEEPLLFIKAQNDRRNFQIYNADGEMFTPVEGTPYTHIGSEGVLVEQWKVQKVDAASLESPAAQLRLALAQKMVEVGYPYFDTFDNLTDAQLQAFKNLWNKADEALANGTCDILYEKLVNDLDAAVRGEYVEPVYNKYQEIPLRVMSYNVKHCVGNHDGLNLPRTASVIAAQDADVVALQEVDSVFSSRSDYKYQVKELAEATGMYGIFCSALTGYGIGILTKQLPLSIKVVSLTPDFEPRRMLIAEFDNYIFASIHVGLNASARRGTGPVIKAEAERWVAKGKPFIIAGDFNDDGTDDEMQGARGVLTEYLQQNGFTYHSDLTTPTWSDGIYVIDHIISYDPIGGVGKVSCEVIDDKVTSDHMPIVGNFIVGFEDPDAIGNVGAVDKIQCTTDEVYNLSGQMVNGKLPQGVYIFNGKKILK